MTTEVERLLPLVDQFLKAKPDGPPDEDWFKAAAIAHIASVSDNRELVDWLYDTEALWNQVKAHIYRQTRKKREFAS